MGPVSTTHTRGLTPAAALHSCLLTCEQMFVTQVVLFLSAESLTEQNTTEGVAAISLKHDRQTPAGSQRYFPVLIPPRYIARSRSLCRSSVLAFVNFLIRSLLCLKGAEHSSPIHSVHRFAIGLTQEWTCYTRQVAVCSRSYRGS